MKFMHRCHEFGDFLKVRHKFITSSLLWPSLYRHVLLNIQLLQGSAATNFRGGGGKGAITSKIKHAIKLKTSPARLAQLLQASLAFCFSLQPMTAHNDCKLKQNANEGCNSCRTCFKLYCMFYFTCDRSLTSFFHSKYGLVIMTVESRWLLKVSQTTPWPSYLPLRLQ